MSSNKVKVLVVDDSAFMRKAISETLNSSDDIEVIATARHGVEALKKVADLEPNVITLDIEMPIMDGITALKQIMKFRPTPVIMLSSLTSQGSKVTLDCLDLGAVDFVHKPSGQISLDIYKVSSNLIDKVKTAAGVKKSSILNKPKPAQSMPVTPLIAPLGKSFPLIVIGASTGGPQSLSLVIEALPMNLPAGLLIVQHMPVGFTKHFSERLDSLCRFSVTEAESGVTLEQGKAYLAPGGKHMELKPRGIIQLNENPPIHGVRPAVDVTMLSVAQNHKGPVIGVILTGMGQDGAAGMLAMHSKGAVTIAEDESTCVVFGMPKAAIKTGCVDLVRPLEMIPSAIMEALKNQCKTALSS